MVQTCTRLIAQRYLLNGELGSLKSDSEVKVLLKSLAMDCIAKALRLNPDLICLAISDNQNLYDVLLYIKHKDEKIKTNACVLIGSLVNSVLIIYNGNYLKWMKKIKSVPNGESSALNQTL
jgi:hypothetical protein